MTEQKTIELVPLETLREQCEAWVESVKEQEAELTAAENTFLQEHVSKAAPPAKRDQVALFILRLEHEEKFYQEHAARMAERARQMKRLRERLKFGIKTFMEMEGITKAEGHSFTFAIRRNPPSCKVVMEEDVPGEYMNYDPKPDKAKILGDLKEGKEIPGAVLVTDVTRLEIK